MKIKKKLFLIGLMGIALCSCNNGNDKEPVIEETLLTKDVDYVSHNDTYSVAGFEYDNTQWYLNKLEDLPLPDPHVFVEDGVYYITGTSDESNAKQIDIYYTTDFINYEKAANVYKTTSNSWENSNPTFYAPEVYCFDGVYYLYYSAMAGINKDGIYSYRRYNSVVKADNPLGPYEPIINEKVNGKEKPLFAYDNCTTLDATIFKDDDNQLYMYYSATYDSGQVIIGVEMDNPYQANWNTRKELVMPGYNDSTFTSRDLEWEMWRANPITEAPYMLKSKNGTYYLTYSVNGCFNKYYSVCYAESDSPLGNFVKPYIKDEMWTNLLFGYAGEKESTGQIFNEWNGFASGTGHHCFFNIGEQIMIGYHAHKNRGWNSDSAWTARYFAMDYLFFDETGKPFCNGPTNSLQPLPEAISGYKNIAPSAKITAENVTNISALNDRYVVSNYNLNGEAEREAKINANGGSITMTFDREYKISGLAIFGSSFYDYHLDSVASIHFSNGEYIENLKSSLINFNPDGENFVFPNSGITIEFNKNISASSITLKFNSINEVRLNEIIVLGK